MPLYDDIVSIDKAGASGKKASTWSHSPGIKLLQDHLQAKKRIGQLHPSSDGSPAGGSAKQSTSQGTYNSSRATIITESIHSQHSAGSGSMLGGDWDPNDEYDPLWPNEYEILQRLFLEEEEKRLLEEQQLRQRKILESNEMGSASKLGGGMMSALRGMQDYDEDDNDDDDFIGSRSSATANQRQNRGIAVAPPPSLTKSITSNTNLSDNLESSSKSTDQTASSLAAQQFGVSSVAAKIMSKMGYKEGQGLGKDEQGISKPLEVEKTSAISCKIVAESKPSVSSYMPPRSNIDVSEQSKQQIAANSSTQLKDNSQTSGPAESKSESITELLKNPTKVILLRNMVGPGEVDDDLESETKEECSKYGEVIRCLIYEIPNKKVPDEEAVRIFLEFRRVESAIKAVVDLNGRYFGGRVVKASFFDVDKFSRFELAPTPLLEK